MKKTYIILFIIAVLLVGLFTGVSGIASAEELNYDDCDKVFLKTVRELAETNSDVANLDAEKEVIYDVELNPLGYVYDFALNGERGYAIVTQTDIEGIKISEIYFNAENPYIDSKGIRIYISEYLYAEFADEIYTIIESGLKFTKDELLNVCEDAYRGINDGISYGESQIYYTYRTVNSYNMASRIPSYTADTLSNACSPIAGGNIIAYFDRYKTELISNYTPGVAIGSGYIYKNTNPNISAMITQLFSDMGTNSIVPGTTENQFIQGMQKYCTRQGYSISFTDCMSKGSLNYTYLKQQIDYQKPVAFFLSKYNLTDILEDDGNDKLDYLIGTINHMMVGFGYKEITYTFANGSTRTDSYVNVASGLSQKGNGYFNIVSNSTINSAYSINIL